MLSDSFGKTWLFCAALVLIGLIGSLTIDMYVPVMPDVARSLGVSATAIKLSLSYYLVPYAFGQLFYGSLSDCFGRKRILLPAIIIGVIGSASCATASTITHFYMGQVLQGAGFSAIGAIAPAMARDVFDDIKFAQVGSILSLVFGLGPIFSPIFGSYIGHFFGWHMIFIIISIYSLFAIFIIFFVTETHDKKHRHVFHIVPILKTYFRILTDAIFLKNTLSKSAAYTGFIVFYTVTPFMLQDHLKLTVIQYGWVTLTLTSSILLAKLVNTLLLKYVDINRIIFLSTLVLLFASSLLLALSLFNFYSVTTIVVPFIIFGVGSGFLFSNATVAAFHSFKKVAAGSVSGLLNGLQLLSAFVGSAISAHLGITSLLPLAIFMCCMSLLTVTQYVYLEYKSQNKLIVQN